MTNGNDVCTYCDGDRGIHHYQTEQCPFGGVEAPIGREQEWSRSHFTVFIPFNAPHRLLKEMTKREYFAAMAASGLAGREGWAFDNIPQNAVEIADALIEALNKEC